ncbi:hypothetical protein BJ742DRAFT_767765 [Cladochytrium replicatum]|nr:hypothetical protein BJ742DRAFT_767765 [Cladochytrium replicatum]
MPSSAPTVPFEIVDCILFMLSTWANDATLEFRVAMALEDGTARSGHKFTTMDKASSNAYIEALDLHFLQSPHRGRLASMRWTELARTDIWMCSIGGRRVDGGLGGV